MIFPKGHPKYTAPLSRDHLSYSIDTERERYLAQYTIEEIQFILSNIDRDFEREVLKYTYDDIDKYIEDRIAGSKPYEGPPKLPDDLSYRRLQLIHSFVDGSIECRENNC